MTNHHAAEELKNVVPTTQLRALDLFSGMGGWSQAFKDRGHEVVRIELDNRYEADIHMDIMEIQPHYAWFMDNVGDFDIILASPPCERFSIASRGIHWEWSEDGFVPRTREAVEATRLTLHTLFLLHALKPTAAIMENPRGLMRKILPIKPTRTVWYCRYGDTRAKPTDLWAFGAARQFYFEPECHNGNPDHVAAPRGSKTGTQGRGDYWEKSLVPYGLSLAMCEQMEQYKAGELVPGRLAV